MLNHLTIMGRLCGAPELRRTQNGVSVCNARIAVERDYADQSGERATDFYDVVAWRGTAEFLFNYFGKGRKVLLDGRLQTRTWTDKNDNNRVNVEIVAESVYFADSKPAENPYLPPASEPAPAKGSTRKGGKGSKAA